MRKWHAISVAGMLSAASVISASAADLNAPIINSPTVRSELARGSSAAAHCLSPFPLVLARCVLDLENQNHQRLTSYEPFALGLKFDAWLILDTWAYPKPESNLAPNQQAQQVAAVMFMSFRDYQSRLGITDDQLIASAAEGGANPNAVRARLEFWARQPRPF